jgi:hypothetical protein
MNMEHMEGFISACYIWSLIAVMVAGYYFYEAREEKKGAQCKEGARRR